VSSDPLLKWIVKELDGMSFTYLRVGTNCELFAHGHENLCSIICKEFPDYMKEYLILKTALTLS